MTVLCSACEQRRAEKVDTDESRAEDGTIRVSVKRYECPCGAKGTYYVHEDGTEQVTGCLTTEVTA